MPYFLYSIKRESDQITYEFIKECSLFGCKKGFIPYLLKRQLPASQGEPYKWHLPVRASLNEAGYTDSALIIDLTPKRKPLSLYEVLDVWGHSGSGWTPALVHLSGLFVDEPPDGIDRNNFVIRDNERKEPVYTFWYFDGSVADGQIVGKWSPPGPSPTNSAVLWPDVLAYFFESIEK